MTPCVPYGWGPVGQQQSIKSGRKRLINVLGLLNPKTNELISFLTRKSINTTYMISCLDNFAATLEKSTVLVLDQASYHQSSAIKARMVEWQAKGLYLFLLPTYSPHLNPIEIVWRFIKYKWLKPIDYLSPDKLYDKLTQVLTNYGDKYSIEWE